MPIRVRWKNIAGNECTIRPTPLISISTNINKTGAGDALGVTYSITLTGTLLPDEGTPYALSTGGGVFAFYDYPGLNYTGPYNSFDNNMSHYGNFRPPKQIVGENQAAHAILMKQRSLRALFADDGQRMEITDVEFDSASIVCFPRVISIDFTEGTYIDKCDYSITLEADTLWSMGAVDGEGNRDSSIAVGNSVVGATEDAFLLDGGNAYITDFNEEWSIETDEGQGEVVSLDNTFIPRSYRITHNVSATGKDHYKPDGAGSERMLAWIQAKKFVIARLSSDPANNNDEYDNDLSLHGYPNNDPLNTTTGRAYPALFGQIGAGTLDLIAQYNGFNHSRTENINESAGSYSVTETWLMASGTAYENYNMSVNSSNSDPFIAVSIDGNIKGLSVRLANDSEYGGRNDAGDAFGVPTQYNNALAHYNSISNNGSFGVGSMVYKRANNQTQVQLNAEPNSIALGVNEFAGELTYSLAFDNRPTNIISNTLGETININDTYPGDVFATIPVIGRPTGPVLQYIGGRTEYKRDISVNLVMDYTKIPYDSGRPALLLTKPSVSEPTASELATLLESLSPAGEPGVRKYFINAPSESWEPKTGNYSFNISFTYELDK
jgi:hypothetical protein